MMGARVKVNLMAAVAHLVWLEGNRVVEAAAVEEMREVEGGYWVLCACNRGAAAGAAGATQDAEVKPEQRARTTEASAKAKVKANSTVAVALLVWPEGNLVVEVAARVERREP